MTEQDVQASESASGETDERRTFIAKIAAIAIGSLAAIGPFVAGLTVFLDPLRRKGTGSSFVRVATLDAIPADGIPRAFAVVKVIESQFTTYPRQPVGRVFLRREKGEGADTVTAFHATCTHAGCDVEFKIDPQSTPGKFMCPCHGSKFEADGSRIEGGVAPRDLDSLEIDEAKLKDGEIWVDFKNFRAAIHEKIEA